MRVLFITSRVPGGGPRGDQVRALEQIRRLARRHQVVLVALDPLGEAGHLPDEVRQLCEDVVVVAHPKWRAGISALQALWTNTPIQVALSRSRPLLRAVSACLSGPPFDLVHVQLARMGWLLDWPGLPPCTVDLVDMLSTNMLRRAQFDPSPLRWLAALDATRLARYESSLSSRAAAVAVSTPEDPAALVHRGRVLPACNGVDLDKFPFVEAARYSRELIFAGNLGYFPNIDAISWLVQHAMPALLQRHADLRLTLVGARPNAAIRRMATELPGIDLIGPVPDVQPYLSRATIAVVPLRAGSGQQLKILEAMASGLPVVTSQLAANSLGAVHGEHLLTFEDAVGCAAAVTSLLEDPTAQRRLARNARRFVEQRYSWDIAAAQLEAAWQRAAAIPSSSVSDAAS